MEELLESVNGEAACESMHPSAELSLELDANNKWVGGTDSWMQTVGSSTGSEIAEQCQHKHLP